MKILRTVGSVVGSTPAGVARARGKGLSTLHSRRFGRDHPGRQPGEGDFIDEGAEHEPTYEVGPRVDSEPCPAESDSASVQRTYDTYLATLKNIGLTGRSSGVGSSQGSGRSGRLELALRHCCVADQRQIHCHPPPSTPGPAFDVAPVWMSTAQPASVVGVTTRTLYQFINAWMLPANRFGSVIRLQRSDVDAFIEKFLIAPGTLLGDGTGNTDDE